MDKKSLLLKSALELFVNQDIDKTSTASIAKHAGVSNGTMFHYFPSKNDLIIELYLLLKEEMFEFIYSEEMNNARNLKQMITEGCLNAVSWICANPAKHNYIHKIYKSNYNSLIEEDQLPESYLKYIKVIEQGIQDKELKDIPLDLMLSIINSLVGALAEYYILSKKKTEKNLNTIVFNMIWESIQHK